VKNYLFLFIFFLIINCVSNSGVYWCGDHQCINKKEKQAYFKKTMIVEKKNVKKDDYRNKSEIEKLLKQAKIDEKNRIKSEKEIVKQAKLERKRRIQEEKRLAKQARLEEKRAIKEEKKLKKQAKLEEKMQIQEEREIAKELELEEKSLKKNNKSVTKKNIVKKENNIKEKRLQLSTDNGNVEIKLNKFSDLVEKISKKNNLKPYPDINDIPN